MTFGSEMKVCRKEKGLTQAKLAKAIGVTGQTVSKWETDSLLPSVLSFALLCETLDISVYRLLNYLTK